MPLEDVLEAVPELRGEREVEPLAGGLTNTNFKVTTPGGRYVVRISGKDTGLLAIDRENEAHNTIAAAESGVGARSALGAGSLPGGCAVEIEAIFELEQSR